MGFWYFVLLTFWWNTKTMGNHKNPMKPNACPL
jgi:hypothetical protein